VSNSKVLENSSEILVAMVIPNIPNIGLKNIVAMMLVKIPRVLKTIG
jgi:hypothetical protein